MKSAPLSAPFALGTFSATGTGAFPRLVVPEGRVPNPASAPDEPGERP